MPAKKYHVLLSESQRAFLQKFTTRGIASARKLNRARILLLSDESDRGASKNDEQIAELLGISQSTVVKVRQRFAEGGLDNALEEKPRPGAPPKLDGKDEATLTAIACSQAPEGRSRWTLRLLADKLVELKVVDSISHVCVGNLLKKTTSSRG